LLDLARSCGKTLKDNPTLKNLPEEKKIEEIQKHLFEGAYYWITGPTYESKIECDFLMQLGTDAVGMSTVPEFLAAAAIGMKTLGIAMITDTMDRIGPLNHLEVLENAIRAIPVMLAMLLEIIKKLEMKPEIRAEIDSHIEYKGDVSKIEELPLVQARGLIPHKEDQLEEAVSGIRKAMGQLEIKELDLGYLFLNTAKPEQIAKYHESYIQIPIKKLPNVPQYSASVKHGMIVIGRLACSGLSCLSICNLEIENFKNFEAYFITRLIRKLNINLVYSVVPSEWVFRDETAVLPLGGYFYRGFGSSVNPESKLKCGLAERERINKIISRLKPSIHSNPILFGYEGPLKPTDSELRTAVYLKFDVYSTSSL
jgi:hypothetical protein